MPDHAIRNGLNIPIAGAASGDIATLDHPATIAYCPVEFKGLVPRLSAREGDEVQRGQPLFHSKAFPEMVFCSPVTGKVIEVRRGRRRVITDIVVEVADADAPGIQWDPVDIASASPGEIREALLARGQWGAFRTRPLNNIPGSGDTPQAILVSATETGPLMPGPDVLLPEFDLPSLKAGLTALAKLAPVHLCVPTGSKIGDVAQGLPNVTVHGFSGPHPAGDASVQVNHVSPPKGTGRVWTVKAWDVVEMANALTTGVFPNIRIFAAVGEALQQPRFVKTVTGAPIQHVTGASKPGDVRWIRGSVLTGTAVDGDRWVSHFARAIHALPDQVESELLGWALPMFGLWSSYKAFLKGWTGASKPVDLRPGVYGGRRGLVPIGVYQSVMATPDILPDFLLKSLVADDLEEAIQLGLLDMTNEEAALCSFICPSKIEFGEHLQRGLEMYEKEAM